MRPEVVAVTLEVVVGLIVIPWCAWVTASIFGLRTQTAIMQEQLKSVQNIEALVVKSMGANQDGKRS